MKKRFDPARWIPVGYDWESLKTALVWGHVLSGLGTMMVLVRYADDRSNLYAIPPGGTEKVLIPGRTVAPYGTYWVDGPLFLFWCVMAFLAVQVVQFYLGHYRESMSIYTMRRLPDRWELHRRCWTVPVLAAVSLWVMTAALAGVYYMIYLGLTPQGCLP